MSHLALNKFRQHFTYFEKIGSHKESDLLEQVGNFLTNIYYPLKNRVRLADKSPETLKMNHCTLNYIYQAILHTVLPVFVRGIVASKYVFVAKTFLAACVVSAVACTLVGIVCLHYSTTHQEAFQNYMRQTIDAQLSGTHPPYESLAKCPVLTLALYYPANKIKELLPSCDQVTITKLFEEVERQSDSSSGQRMELTDLLTNSTEQKVIEKCAAAILEARFKNKTNAINVIFANASKRLQNEIICLAPITSDGQMSLVSIANSRSVYFAKQVPRLRNDIVLDLLGNSELKNTQKALILLHSVPHLPFNTQEFSLVTILTRAADKPRDAPTIYRSLAATNQSGELICPYVARCLKECMDAKQRLRFFSALGVKQKAAVEKTKDMLDQDEIAEMILYAATTPPSAGVVAVLMTIDKAHAAAIKDMPASYVKALSSQLPIEDAHTTIDIADLLKHAQEDTTLSGVVNNRSLSELQDLYVQLKKDAFIRLVRVAPLQPAKGMIGLPDIIDKIGSEKTAKELEKMLDEKPPVSTNRVIAMVKMIESQYTKPLAAKLIKHASFKQLLTQLELRNSNHLCLLDLVVKKFDQDLTKQELLARIVAKAKKTDVGELKGLLKKDFPLLLFFAEVRVENDGLDFATIRKKTEDPKTVYASLWLESQARFWRMVACMPKTDIDHFPEMILDKEGYDNLAEKIAPKSDDSIDLQDCLKKFNSDRLARAFLRKRKKEDAQVFLELFRDRLETLASSIPLTSDDHIDVVSILVCKPGNAEAFVRACNFEVKSLVQLLPFVPVGTFDEEIEQMKDPHLIDAMKKMSLVHGEWYNLAYLVEKFPDRVIPLMVGHVLPYKISLYKIHELITHFGDNNPLGLRITVALAKAHRKEDLQSIVNIGIGKTGIVNETRDVCFLSSALQACLRSKLILRFLLDKNNLNKRYLNKILECFNQFKKTVFAYDKAIKAKEQLKGINQFRILLGPQLSKPGQHDPVEAFETFFGAYDIQGHLLFTEIEHHKTVFIPPNRNTFLSISESDRKKYTEIKSDHILREKKKNVVLLRLQIPYEQRQTATSATCPLVFSDLYNNLIIPQKEDEPCTVIYNNQLLKTKFIESKMIIKKLPNVLFIAINRFYYSKKTDSRTKLYNEVTIKKQENFSGELFNFRGFILHDGNIDCGHCTYYFKDDNDKWQCFNDSQVYEVPTKKALDISKKGYLFYFEKVNHSGVY